jgi:hypothetical protein
MLGLGPLVIALRGVAGTWMLGLRRVRVTGPLFCSSSSSSAIMIAVAAGFFGAFEIEVSKVSLVGDRRVIVDFLVITFCSSANVFPF